jgi:hypothetical protein
VTGFAIGEVTTAVGEFSISFRLYLSKIQDSGGPKSGWVYIPISDLPDSRITCHKDYLQAMKRLNTQHYKYHESLGSNGAVANILRNLYKLQISSLPEHHAKLVAKVVRGLALDRLR